MSKRKISIGLAGLGHLGKIHARILAGLDEDFEVIGVFDTDPEAARSAAETHGFRVFDRYEDMLAAVEAVDIVTPTSTHHVLAKAALASGKHIFIEKPITATLEEAKELCTEARERGLWIQVGHVERFNPALRSLDDRWLRPAFIEAHRLAEPNLRALDVSVVLDLMIHDLDIVLSLIDSPIERLSASGVAVVGNSIDIANARLDFENGATANLTASRISQKAMRKLRLFQQDAYISVDLLKKNSQIVRLSEPDPDHPGLMELDTARGRKTLHMETPEAAPINAIEEELKGFAACLRENKPPAVTADQATAALEVAFAILEEIDKRRSKLEPSLA